MKDRRYIDFVVKRKSNTALVERKETGYKTTKRLSVSRTRFSKKTLWIVIIAVAVAAVGIALFFFIPRAPERDRQMYSSKSIVENYTYSLDSVLWCKTKDSDILDAVGYEKKENVLFVVYRGDKTVYAYMYVPESKWNGLISADFIDRYFTKNIKESYLHSSTTLRYKG